jgi:hypothetical protein
MIYLIFFIIVLVIIVINVSIKKSSSSNNELVEPIFEDQSNKVVNVTMIGGIIGLLANSPIFILNNVIAKESSKGWKVIQVIPAESGNVFLVIFRLLLLLITLFLYTTANGYYIILEKK